MARLAEGFNPALELGKLFNRHTLGISKAVLCAGVEFKWGVEGVLENLPILRDMGYLPMYDLELWPRPAQKMALATESEQKERQLELVPA